MAVSEPVLNSSIVSLRQAIKGEGFKFPIIVKTCGNEDVYELEDSSQQIPSDSILLLEAQENVCYAHVKVATLENEKAVAGTKGVEYVTEYNRLVGKEVLIPIRLSNKVKIIHKPGKRKRYAVISEILESLPHYLRAEADTSSCFPGSDDNKKVPKGTELEVTKVSSTDGTTFLECKRKNEKHFFSCDSVVNFTAVADPKEYTLEKLVSKVLLPKFVKFQECLLPDDVIVYDDESASEALLMTFGPLEVIGKRRRHFITGWLRTKDKSFKTVTYKRILIPNSHWDKEKVRLFTFPTNKAKDAFCKKNFKIYKTSQSYENKFYMLPTESAGITYLRTAETMTMALEDDSSDESSDYEKPVSAPPPRAPLIPVGGLRATVTEGVEVPITEAVLLPIAKNKIRPDVWQKLVERAKQGFGHIHNELLYFFSAKNKTQDTTEYSKQQVTSTTTKALPGLRSSQQSHKEPWAPGYSVSRTEGTKGVAPKPKPKPLIMPTLQPPVPDCNASGETPPVIPTRPPKPTHISVSVPENASEAGDTHAGHLENSQSHPASDNALSEDFYIEMQPAIPTRPPKPTHISVSVPENASEAGDIHAGHLENIQPSPASDSALAEDFYIKMQPATPSPSVKRPLPAVPEETHDYEYPDVDDWVPERTKNTTPYGKVTAVEVHKVTLKNQTAKDFCEYTVNQVCECFNRCAMEDVARVCWEEKIDGAFLANFDLEQLKLDPFFLNDFGVNKVKQIIVDGWRPSVDN